MQEPNKKIIADKEKLIAIYEDIYQHRMMDIPVCNHKLMVSATDFIELDFGYLTVLVTPWFMNLVLLPLNPDDWEELETLTKQMHHFPSGKYEFVVGKEDELGIYQSCSLFSPMFEFADLKAANETAEIILKELMNEENVDNTSLDRSKEIQEIWQGDKEVESIENKEQESVEDALDLSTEDNLEISKKVRKIDRRQLLRGDFSHTESNLSPVKSADSSR